MTGQSRATIIAAMIHQDGAIEDSSAAPV